MLSINGGAAGITANLSMYPKPSWTIVILSNYDPSQNFTDLVKKAEGLAAQT